MRRAIDEASQLALDEGTLWLIAVGVVIWLVAFPVLLLVSVWELLLRRSIATYFGAVVLGTYLSPLLFLLGLVVVGLMSVDLHSWQTSQHGSTR